MQAAQPVRAPHRARPPARALPSVVHQSASVRHCHHPMLAGLTAPPTARRQLVAPETCGERFLWRRQRGRTTRQRPPWCRPPHYRHLRQRTHQSDWPGTCACTIKPGPCLPARPVVRLPHVSPRRYEYCVMARAATHGQLSIAGQHAQHSQVMQQRPHLLSLLCGRTGPAGNGSAGAPPLR